MYHIIFALYCVPFELSDSTNWRRRTSIINLIFRLTVNQDEVLLHGIAAHALYVLPSSSRLLR